MKITNETLAHWADKMRTELFAPLGLEPAKVPIRVVSPGPQQLFGYIYGQPYETAATVFNADRTKPTAIELLPEEFHFSSEANNVITMAADLAHEMLHSALPWKAAHGPDFAKPMAGLGLIGPPQGSRPGPNFIRWFNSTLAKE